MIVIETGYYTVSNLQIGQSFLPKVNNSYCNRITSSFTTNCYVGKQPDRHKWVHWLPGYGRNYFEPGVNPLLNKSKKKTRSSDHHEVGL